MIRPIGPYYKTKELSRAIVPAEGEDNGNKVKRFKNLKNAVFTSHNNNTFNTLFFN